MDVLKTIIFFMGIQRDMDISSKLICSYVISKLFSFATLEEAFFMRPSFHGMNHSKDKLADWYRYSE